MVVTAESGLPAVVVQPMAADQQHDGSVGVLDPAVRAAPVAAVGRRRKKARPEARTEFRGVSRTESGRYGAQIKDPKDKAQVWLGTFDTAEEAARAYDAAAVKLRGAAARPNFPAVAAADDDGVAQHLPCECADKGATAEPSSPVKKKMMKAARRLRGVLQMISGRYGAQITHSKTVRWLGTFDTAEDAARAYDAAAVELHGERAVTNFKAGGGVSESFGQAAGSVKMKKVKKPAAARADARIELQGVHGELGGECTARTWDSKDFDLLDDFPELPALDFPYSLIPGPLLDDLRSNLPPAERQLVDEFIKDIDFTDLVN